VQGKIALEEHFLPEGFEGTMFSSIGWDPSEWERVVEELVETGERRLAAMDDAGVEICALSLAAPCIQEVVDPAEAVRLAVAANDALAEVVAARPDRYVGLAALPLQDPAASAEELERAVRVLGFRGTLVNGYSNIGSLETGAYYDEPQYLPFWERVAALDVPFYLHPRNPLPNQRRTYEGREELLGPTWAFTAETAIHALRLITSGLFDHLPGLAVVLGHMGELLPFAIERSAQRLSHIPSISLERPLPRYLSENFFLTTSGNFHTASLIGSILQVGADRILFSADYPFERITDASEWFDAVPISEADRLKIGRTNALELLRLS
jgi:2,3-dihydroxybenzoate decarboxylase